MCIVVCKPVKAVLDKTILERCKEGNGDGMGFAVLKNKEFIVNKSMDDLNGLWDKYKETVGSNEKQLNALWHFRIATHGEKSLLNCHPFLLENNEYVFAHNGIISGNSVTTGVESDTLMFKNIILDKLPKKFVHNEALIKLIRAYIGSWSKIVFLGKDGDVFIMGEDEGEWKDGIWYSNSSYKPAFISTLPARRSYNYHNADSFEDLEWDYSDNAWKKRSDFSSKRKLSSLIRTATVNTKDKDHVPPGTICMGCGQPLYKFIEIEFGHCTWCMEKLRLGLTFNKRNDRDDYAEYAGE